METTNQLTTKQVILAKATELFATHGYQGTTTRMIADKADVNVASISFHFRNKEGLYVAVMDYAAQTMEDYFKAFSTKIHHYLSGNTYPEQTMAYIEEFIDLILNVAKDNNQYPIVFLLTREQMNPPAGEYPLSKIVLQQSERILVSLILNLSDQSNEKKVKIYSRLIIGGIISQAENPFFLKKSLGIEGSQPLDDCIWQEIREFALINIQSIGQLIDKK